MLKINLRELRYKIEDDILAELETDQGGIA